MAYSDYNQQFWDLGKRFAEESSGVWQRYAKMATRSQHLDAETFRQRLTTFWQQDTPEYTRRLMQIHLDYTVNMMKMGLEFSNVMLDSLFGEVSSEASTSPASPPSGAGAGTLKPSNTDGSTTANTDIHFKGKPGATLSENFVVSNRESRTIDVGFEVSTWVCEDGSSLQEESLQDVKIDFLPTTFALDAGREQVVTCQVVLNNHFQPGKQYAAMARVVGFPRLLLRLLMDVE